MKIGYRRGLTGEGGFKKEWTGLKGEKEGMRLQVNKMAGREREVACHEKRRIRIVDMRRTSGNHLKRVK